MARIHYELEYKEAQKPEHISSLYDASRRAEALVKAGKGPVRILECTRVKYGNHARAVVAVLS